MHTHTYIYIDIFIYTKLHRSQFFWLKKVVCEWCSHRTLWPLLSISKACSMEALMRHLDRFPGDPSHRRRWTLRIQNSCPIFSYPIPGQDVHLVEKLTQKFSKGSRNSQEVTCLSEALRSRSPRVFVSGPLESNVSSRWVTMHADMIWQFGYCDSCQGGAGQLCAWATCDVPIALRGQCPWLLPSRSFKRIKHPWTRMCDSSASPESDFLMDPM